MSEFGDRMKYLEQMEAGRRVLPLLPVMARLDGRSFHNFTRGNEKHFDSNFCSLIIVLAEFLVQETGACMGYTQSDEISLCWYSSNYRTQIFFDGKIQKMVSTLAALVSAKMQKLLPDYFPKKSDELPMFDCRVWTVPTREEAANVFLWRELDATRNSISSAAQFHYSSSQLHKKNSSEMQELLHQKGVNWNDYPDYFKRGTFIQRRKVFSKFTPKEIEKLPVHHAARKDPDLTVERSWVERIKMPPFTKVTNRVGVIFDGEEPKIEDVTDR